jgi:signal transduction histidine kinase
MRKITVKIIIASIIITMISSILPRILFDLYNVNSNEAEIDKRILLLAAFIAVFTAFTLFNIFMRRVILYRIRDLNNATNEVMKGNYDFKLEMKQNDELSDLSNNFNRMVKELQSNEYLNKEFVRNISHELKTPLSAINGYAELINTNTLTDEEIKKYAGIIASESKRLSVLAKDILQISLIESSTIIQQDDHFKISEQIRNTLQLTQLKWESKNIEFDLDLEKVEFTSNKEITFQIWTNLISNAIKFSENGSIIKISLKRTGDNIVFTISNPGHISKEDQDKVFELFYIANKSQGRDSNGVGLALASRIIQKLHGTISLSSLDNIVTFTVTIPTGENSII